MAWSIPGGNPYEYLNIAALTLPGGGGGNGNAGGNGGGGNAGGNGGGGGFINGGRESDILLV